MIGGQKLNEKIVIEISEKFSEGYAIENLAIEYNVTKKSIENILYGNTWKNVDRKIFTH